MFNVLALVWLELARLMISLVCLLVLLWFGLVGLVACFAFVRFALLCLLALLCFAWLVCFACLVFFALQRYAMLDMVGFNWTGLAGVR